MADWISANDVKTRLGVAETAKGYEDSDIDERIERAQNRIKAKLQSTFSLDTINEWDGTTAPSEVKEWAKDLAAAYILSDYGGQSLLDKLSRAGSLFNIVEGNLEGVRLGKIQIVDTANESVEPVDDVIESTTQGKTPLYSMNHPDDSGYGDGSLDEL